MAYVDRYVLEEDLLTQVQEELERVRPKFENENLVICEPDYVFNNRFWTPHLDHCDPVDYNREVLLRSTLLLKNLAKFTNLKRLKVSEISFAQLRRLEQVAGLEVLEIDLLTVDTTFNFNVPLKFQQLQCMRIGEYKSNLLTSIPFRTPSLVAVSFGTVAINHIRFQGPSTVAHCEFEEGGLAYCSLDELIVEAFPDLKVLVCHQILKPQNQTAVMKLTKMLPFLSELHCHFSRLTSLTTEYKQYNVGNIQKLLRQLSTQQGFATNPALQIFVQKVPLSEFQLLAENRFCSSTFELQQALIASKTASLECKRQVHRPLMHAELRKLCEIAPQLKSDRNFQEEFNRRFPDLQAVEVNLSYNRSTEFDSESVIEVLESLRSVSMMAFSSCNFMPKFYLVVLPSMPCLVNTLVVLKIFEPRDRTLLAGMDFSFLQHFRQLRKFESNIIRKGAILPTISVVAHYPVAFYLRFSSATGCHSANIKKVAQDKFELGLVERKYKDLDKGDSAVNLGTLSSEQLKLKLDQDPLCVRLLKHPFDDLDEQEIQKMPRNLLEEGLRTYRAKTEELQRVGLAPASVAESFKRSLLESDAANKRARLASDQQPQASTSQPAQEMMEVDEDVEDVVCLDESEDEFSSDDEQFEGLTSKDKSPPTPPKKTTPPNGPSSKYPAQQSPAKVSAKSAKPTYRVPYVEGVRQPPTRANEASKSAPIVVQTTGTQPPATVPATVPTQAPATVSTNGSAQPPATVQATKSTQSPSTQITTSIKTYPVSSSSILSSLKSILATGPISSVKSNLALNTMPYQAVPPLQSVSSAYYPSAPTVSSAYYPQSALPVSSAYYAQGAPTVQTYPLMASQPWQSVLSTLQRAQSLPTSSLFQSWPLQAGLSSSALNLAANPSSNLSYPASNPNYPATQQFHSLNLPPWPNQITQKSSAPAANPTAQPGLAANQPTA